MKVKLNLVLIIIAHLVTQTLSESTNSVSIVIKGSFLQAFLILYVANNKVQCTTTTSITGDRIKHRNPRNQTHREAKVVKELTMMNRQSCLSKILCGAEASEPPSPYSSTVNDVAYLIKSFFDILSLGGGSSSSKKKNSPTKDLESEESQEDDQDTDSRINVFRTGPWMNSGNPILPDLSDLEAAVGEKDGWLFKRRWDIGRNISGNDERMVNSTALKGNYKRRRNLGFMGFTSPRFDKTAFLDKKQLELEQAETEDEKLDIAAEVANKLQSPRQCRLVNMLRPSYTTTTTITTTSNDPSFMENNPGARNTMCPFTPRELQQMIIQSQGKTKQEQHTVSKTKAKKSKQVSGTRAPIYLTTAKPTKPPVPVDEGSDMYLEGKDPLYSMDTPEIKQHKQTNKAGSQYQAVAIDLPFNEPSSYWYLNNNGYIKNPVASLYKSTSTTTTTTTSTTPKPEADEESDEENDDQSSEETETEEHKDEYSSHRPTGLSSQNSKFIFHIPIPRVPSISRLFRKKPIIIDAPDPVHAASYEGHERPNKKRQVSDFKSSLEFQQRVKDQYKPFAYSTKPPSRIEVFLNQPLRLPAKPAPTVKAKLGDEEENDDEEESDEEEDDYGFRSYNVSPYSEEDGRSLLTSLTGNKKNDKDASSTSFLSRLPIHVPVILRSKRKGKPGRKEDAASSTTTTPKPKSKKNSTLRPHSPPAGYATNNTFLSNILSPHGMRTLNTITSMLMPPPPHPEDEEHPHAHDHSGHGDYDDEVDDFPNDDFGPRPSKGGKRPKPNRPPPPYKRRRPGNRPQNDESDESGAEDDESGSDEDDKKKTTTTTPKPSTTPTPLPPLQLPPRIIGVPIYIEGKEKWDGQDNPHEEEFFQPDPKKKKNNKKPEKYDYDEETINSGEGIDFGPGQKIQTEYSNVVDKTTTGIKNPNDRFVEGLPTTWEHIYQDLIRQKDEVEQKKDKEGKNKEQQNDSEESDEEEEDDEPLPPAVNYGRPASLEDDERSPPGFRPPPID